MLARLLWQTWRESWKLLSAPVGIALLLLAGIGAALGLTQQYNELAAFIMADALAFAPALYGAMVFYPDQRRGNYRFLAEHAARLRYTWLARHIVWLGALFAVWLLMVGGFAAFAWSREEFNSRQMFEYYLEWGIHPDISTIFYGFAFGAEIAVRVATAISFAALLAYGIGQLFSMTIRSEILAAFLALLLTPVVGTWVFVVCAWQLSPALFMLPIFAGLMLATWFRAPDWIAGRNSWRAWLKPACAIVAPLLIVAALLPGVRLAQMDPRMRNNRDYRACRCFPTRSSPSGWPPLKPAILARRRKPLTCIHAWPHSLAAGTSQDPLERWRKPEYLETSKTGLDTSEIDEAKIPPDQLPAFKKAQTQLLNSIKQLIAGAVNEAIEISNRPTCRFHFDPSLFAPTPPATWQKKPGPVQAHDRVKIDPYSQMNQLIGVVAGEPMSTPDEPARRFLAALKMGKQLRRAQPTTVVIEQLRAEQSILHKIDQWSQDSSRKKEELREVLDKLSAQFAAPESPDEALLADHLLILSVIEDKVTPYILGTTPIELHAHLAYQANQLWWERERAGKALDRITRRNLFEMNALTHFLTIMKPRELGISQLRHWLRPDYGGLPELWEIQEPAAVTSYLVSLEYKARVPISELNRAFCDNLVCRRATLLQLALALCRLDHKNYPSRLADLVPDYLEQLPLDLYANQPFQYEPHGLSMRLRPWSRWADREQVEPQTPLLWSVGAADVRLKEMEGEENPPNGDPPPDGEAPPPQKVEPRYEFRTDEMGWHNTKPLVFPLK